MCSIDVMSSVSDHGFKKNIQRGFKKTSLKRIVSDVIASRHSQPRWYVTKEKMKDFSLLPRLQWNNALVNLCVRMEYQSVVYLLSIES